MEISAVDAVPPPAPTVEQGLVIDTCTLRPIELSVSDFAQEYFWTFENAYTEQSSTASDAITVYPNYEPIQFTVRTKYFNDCLSPPTRGRLTFLSPPDAPSIQYDAATTTLAASVAGPILWYYQDELEAETPGRYYKPKYNGFYTARVKGPSCLSDFSNQVVVGGITTAVRDEEASAQVRIFPVPSRDVVHVTIDAGLVHQLPQGMLEYQLFASNGQRVAGGQLDPRLPGTPIPVAGLPAGLYLLTFEHQGKAVLRKRVTVL